jgi:hypothetical protein
MKNGIKAILLAVIVSMLVIGCSQQNNPVENSREVNTTSELLPIVATGTNSADPIFIQLPEYDRVVGATEFTQTINAALGGAIKVKIMYYLGVNKVASLSAQIKFPAGALNQNTNVTIKMDPETMGFEFLPHGITFNTPALLTVDSYGYDLTGFTNKNNDLFYIDNGMWTESYQGRLVKVFPHNGKLMVNDIQLRHFSQYAFGRRY